MLNILSPHCRPLVQSFTRATFCAALTLCVTANAKTDPPRIVEVHHRLAETNGEQVVALTLDACDGGFDADLIDTLLKLRVPATLFVTKKWITKNPKGMAVLRTHPELFQIENHGADHLPAVLGHDVSVYGLKAAGSVQALQRELQGGAEAITRSGAPQPTWYRGATARYDAQSLKEIARLGYQVAGFSVNADVGATLPRRAIVQRLLTVRPGDIVIAHINKPASDTAEAMQEALPVLLARGVRFVKLAGQEVTFLD